MAHNPVDIYSLLTDEDEKKAQLKRQELLRALGVLDDYFEDGQIHISMSLCRGVECQLCIQSCPTHALFWSEGEIKIERDLCIYCSACVLNCIVDNCISITRKRKNGVIDKFSTPREANLIMTRQASNRRASAIIDVIHEVHEP